MGEKIMHLTKEKQDALIGQIRENISQMAFLEQIVKTGKVAEDSVKTHMALFRSYFDDIASLLEADPLSKEIKEYESMLREAHRKIKILEDACGETTSLESAVAHLKHIEEVFATWYALCGFHYASITRMANGIMADFSNEIDAPCDGTQRRHVTFGDKKLASRIMHVVPYAFYEKFEIDKEQFHWNLTDCDKNKNAIMDLVKSAFPNASISRFHGMSDRGKYLLRFEAYVPYSDIRDWEIKVEEEFSKLNLPTGRLYETIYILESTLKNKFFLSHASQEEIKSTNEQLERARTITRMWDEFGSVPMDPETECIEEKWNSFEAGTFREDIWHWFEWTYKISVAEDLMGV